MQRELLTAMVCLGFASSAWAAQSSPNKPPSITGSPASSATVGESYAFAPRAADPEGKALSFSIRGKPAWASFNSKTGRLSGKPANQHVGVNRNVAISVSDGRTSADLPLFNITVDAANDRNRGNSVTLSWMPPMENTDGSVLDDLLGYRIYYGQSANQLNATIVLNNPGLTRYVIQGLAARKWYFAMTSVSREGVESKRSRTVATTVG